MSNVLMYKLPAVYPTIFERAAAIVETIFAK